MMHEAEAWAQHRRDVRVFEHDLIYPRDERHRFRVYAVLGEQMRVIATAGSPEGLGVALVTMHNDAKEVGMRLADLGRIGVLDVLGGRGPAGDWIVLPWDRRT